MLKQGPWLHLYFLDILIIAMTQVKHHDHFNSLTPADATVISNS